MLMREFSFENLIRCESPNGFNHKLESWSPAEWMNAIAGEVGEACNLAKKLLRFRDGVRGNIKEGDKSPEELKARIVKELADVVIYCDLAIKALGGDLQATLQQVWNKKSEDIGYPERL